MLQSLSPGAQSARLEYDSVIESISSSKLRSLGPEVGKLRVIKSECEQRLMRLAADTSGLAHAKVGMSHSIIGQANPSI